MVAAGATYLIVVAILVLNGCLLGVSCSGREPQLCVSALHEAKCPLVSTFHGDALFLAERSFVLVMGVGSIRSEILLSGSLKNPEKIPKIMEKHP